MLSLSGLTGQPSGFCPESVRDRSSRGM